MEAIRAPTGVFVIYGQGNNGKTTFLRLVEKISKKGFFTKT
jgi:predicted ABC-class ATPase